MSALNKLIWSFSRAPLRLIIGAGGTVEAGWLASDMFDPADESWFERHVYLARGRRLNIDITRRDDWERFFRPATLHNVLSEHAFEHLDTPSLRIALQLIRAYLRPDGRLRIAVPDGNRPDAAYLAEVSPPHDGHQQLFTIDTLTTLVGEAGFAVEPLEYYDANGRFHRTDYSEADGKILRCYKRDRQTAFRYADHYYTSIIVDAVKRA